MRSLRFFWSYISPRKDLLILMLTVSAVVAAAELYIPWVVMRAIDAVVERKSIEELNAWAIHGVGLLAVFYLLHVAMIRIEAQLILTASYNLRRRFYSHIINQSLPFFQRHQTGEIIHRIVMDTDEFDEDAGDLMTNLPFDLLSIIGVTIFMSILSWKLAVLVIGLMAVSVIVTMYIGRPLIGIHKSVQSIGARLISRFQEGVIGIRTVKSFGSEQHELDRLDVDNKEILRTELREGKIESVLEPLADLLSLLGLVLVVWYGGILIIEGSLTVGGLVAFIAYMDIISEPLQEVEGYYRDYLSCRAMAERMQDLLDDDERMPTTGTQIPEGDTWPVALNGVTFRHGGTRSIIRDISFDVKPCEVVALVGRNGAGKSTVLDLLLRLHDPDLGVITAAGSDLRDIDPKTWRDSVGVMSQDAFLFHGSILENIAYGNPSASREEVLKAAEESGIAALARRFPKGLETIVGERGARVSGGERQAIALARLFLRKPRILLLDEPTAHLDGVTLRNTLQALRALIQMRTTIMITHQPEAIALADRVIFLERGTVAAQGTHEELLSRNRWYRSLWKEHGLGQGRQQRQGRGQLHAQPGDSNVEERINVD
jgi:subfamily B ATP-binding cassette protein MsbA